MPSLSHSQIETWQACPLRWKLQTLDQVPAAPQPAFLLGTAVHAAIEADNRARLEGQAPLALEDLLDAGRAALVQGLERDDPEDHLQRLSATLALQAKALLTAYHRQIAGRFVPLRIEAPFRVAIPETPDWTFTGRIDALMLDQDGEQVIVDYKTAKRPWPTGAERSKLQATAYLWAAQQADWGAVQHVVFIPLVVTSVPLGYSASAELRPTRRTRDDLVAYTHLLHQVREEMLASAASGFYLAKPGWQCDFCSVAQACPARGSRSPLPPEQERGADQEQHHSHHP
jgi:RecB family exonuclease